MIIDRNVAAHRHVADHLAVRGSGPPAPLIEQLAPARGVERLVVRVVVRSFAEQQGVAQPVADVLRPDGGLIGRRLRRRAGRMEHAVGGRRGRKVGSRPAVAAVTGQGVGPVAAGEDDRILGDLIRRADQLRQDHRGIGVVALVCIEHRIAVLPTREQGVVFEVRQQVDEQGDAAEGDGSC